MYNNAMLKVQYFSIVDYILTELYQFAFLFKGFPSGMHQQVLMHV